jgi:hypothetical protein
MTPLEGIVALLAGMIGIIGTLVRISFQLGVLVQRFNGHVEIADWTDRDHEERLRVLEAPQLPRRRRA